MGGSDCAFRQLGGGRKSQWASWLVERHSAGICRGRLIEAALFQEEGGDEVQRTSQRRSVDQGGGCRQVPVLRGEDGQAGGFFCDMDT